MILTILSFFFAFLLCSCDGNMEDTCAGCMAPNIVTTAFPPGTSDSVQFSTIKDMVLDEKDTAFLYAPRKEGDIYQIGNYQEISAYCDTSNNVIGDVKYKISGDSLFFWLSYENISEKIIDPVLCIENDSMYGLLPRVYIQFNEDPHVNYFIILGVNPILYNIKVIGENQ